MKRPQPMVRRFAVAMLLDQHGVGAGVKINGLFEKDVYAEWAPDWEAVKLTVKETGKAVDLFMSWWPVAPELMSRAEELAVRNLIAWETPVYQRHPS